jgi:hypothetical protein
MKRVPGSQSRSGRGGEEKNSQPLPGLEPPIIQPVAQLYSTDVSRILIIIVYKILVGKPLKEGDDLEDKDVDGSCPCA